MTSDRPPSSLRRLDEARRLLPELTEEYLAGMWRSDPLADAFVADLGVLGHGRGMRMLRTACREGIAAVPQAPASLVALMDFVADVPAWADLAAIDAASVHLGRYTRQAGITLGAASLVSGYANSAASRPLQMTGRYVESAGLRTIEVSSWLVATATAGGLRPGAEGLELTLRVRIIHALVRRALVDDPRWNSAAWGVPINQSYLAYTLTEFCLIPLRGMRAIGAAYTAGEQAAYYARWRYLGHLLGIDAALLPATAQQQEDLETLYLLTRPVTDAYCRDLVGAINREFLVPEIEQLAPLVLHRFAPAVVAGLERVFLGDEICDELGIRRSRLAGVIRVAGPVVGALNATLDRIPGMLRRRTAAGERYRLAQDARLRTRYGVHHDLVDAAPSGNPHPARPPVEEPEETC